MFKGRTLLLFRPLIVIVFCTCVNTALLAQEKFTVSGHIKSSESGEELIGAAFTIDSLQIGVSANVYGFYSMSLPSGRYQITASFLGYLPFEQVLDLSTDQVLNIELIPNSSLLKIVEISAEKLDKNVSSVEMSKVKMEMQQIAAIPALFGEVDLIKAIQLQPGVQTSGEGTSGFYVRGGGVDQNLILMDEATVYNSSHLLGFFSVFNQNAIKDVQLYKGGIPSQYGGRLSSVLDVRMKDGNSKKFTSSGGIGTISSRLTLEGPIKKGKGSIMVAGRRTYADLFLLLSSDEELRNSKLYFYDLNAKVNYRIDENNRFFLSGYFGKDVFSDGEFGFSWGNATTTFRWNHVFNKKLFSNLTLLYSDYNYFLGEESGKEAFEWKSNIADLGAKVDFQYYPNPNNTIRFGLQATNHAIDPGFAKGVGDETIFNELRLQKKHANEYAAYLSNEQNLSSRITVRYGLRYSLFQNIGKETVYSYDDKYEVKDTSFYKSGETIKIYSGFEPRISVKYALASDVSLKASYNHTIQYLHLASNSTASTPLDVWFPSSPNVKPQIADQWAIGYFRNFQANRFETSIELYYKEMKNQIDFEDHAVLLLNKLLEGELRFGEAWSYGAEFMIKKNKGPLTGWLSYTLSRTERKIDAINNGKLYPARYDKTHDIAVVLSYKLNEKWSFGANWIYASGAAVTLPTGRFEFSGMVVPVYSERNSERLPAYHRMDVSAVLQPTKGWRKKYNVSWVFSVYNLYYRKNAFSINFRQDENNPTETYAEKLYMFGIVPAVTLNFEF